MQANANLFAIAQQIRASDSLSYMVIITPRQYLRQRCSRTASALTG